MAASNKRVGFDHVTVVPENFEPEKEDRRRDEETQRTAQE